LLHVRVVLRGFLARIALGANDVWRGPVVGLRDRLVVLHRMFLFAGGLLLTFSESNLVVFWSQPFDLGVETGDPLADLPVRRGF
jgi:hypothetical protein